MPTSAHVQVPPDDTIGILYVYGFRNLKHNPSRHPTLSVTPGIVAPFFPPRAMHTPSWPRRTCPGVSAAFAFVALVNQILSIVSSIPVSILPSVLSLLVLSAPETFSYC